MNIKASVKRVCQFNGTSYENIELTQEDIELVLIRKCESLFSDNEKCTFSVDDLEVTVN
jgi:hypothetical protein